MGEKSSIETMRQPGVTVAAGAVLRQIRLSRSLSLRQVTIRSEGRFKPSSVASYERGERQLSLERLFALASVYDVAPEGIVALIARRLGSSRDGDDTEAAPGPEALELRALVGDARA